MINSGKTLFLTLLCLVLFYGLLVYNSLCSEESRDGQKNWRLLWHIFIDDDSQFF